jgi:hypothetical protein
VILVQPVVRFDYYQDGSSWERICNEQGQRHAWYSLLWDYGKPLSVEAEKKERVAT